MAKQNSSKASATVQRLRVSLLFKLSTTWLREAIKKPMKLWTLSIAPMTPPSMSVNTAVVAMTFSNTMKLIQ